MADMALFLGALLIVYVVPGPDMILLLETGVLRGRGQALAVAVGLAIARAAHVTLAALGLAALFKTHPWAFDAARTVGGIYLMWLGVRLLRAGPVVLDAAGQTPPRGSGLGGALLAGVLTNVLNPKALLFCSVLLPQFIVADGAPVLTQFAMLGMLLVGVGLLFDSAYALTGAALGRWLQHSPTAQRVQQWMFGSLLIGFALRLTFIQQA